MITHIVAWKLNPDNKHEHARKIKELLEALKETIPEIQKIEVGLNSAEAPADNWDVVLYSQFTSMADLEAYQTHPAHKEAGKFIKAVTEQRMCVDYTS